MSKLCNLIKLAICIFFPLCKCSNLCMKYQFGIYTHIYIYIYISIYPFSTLL